MLKKNGLRSWSAALAGAALVSGLTLGTASAQAPAAENPAKPAQPAKLDKTGGGVFSPGGHDVNQPIQIASDSLEVRQEEQLAIFEGNVDAIQGDMRLKTDKLEVYYATDDAESETTTGADSISRMRAIGSVFVSSPKETAQGAWADYDVEMRTLHLHDNVLLTQGENVLCGQQLDMDLNSGVSELKGGCKTGGRAATRVQGVFYPSKSKSDNSSE